MTTTDAAPATPSDAATGAENSVDEAAAVTARSPLRSVTRSWAGWLLLFAAATALLIIAHNRATAPLTADQRVQSIAERLACPVCDGESVAESRAPSARDIRADIAKYVGAGQLTDDEIINAINSASTKDLRLTPQSSGVDLLVWFLPALALTGGLAGLGLAFWRWRRPAAVVGPSEEDRQLVAAARRDAENSTESSTDNGTKSSAGDDAGKR